jgi:hypothetical protein
MLKVQGTQMTIHFLCEDKSKYNNYNQGGSVGNFCVSGSLENNSSKVIDIVPLLEKKRKEKEEKLRQESYMPELPRLSEVADALVQLTIVLDGLGHFKYADKISDVIGEMFEDDALKDEDFDYDD